MKKRKIISAKSLITFLRYSLIGLFLWNTLKFAVFLVYQLGPALFLGKRKGVSLPIDFNPTDKGILTLTHTDYEYLFQIPEATGKFLAFGLPLRFFYIDSIGTILNYACGLIMIYLIIKMLKNAQDDTFLISKNAIRLRYIALLNILLLLYNKIFLFLSTSYLIDKIEFPGIEFHDITWHTLSGWQSIFLYLFLLIIAEAFRLGAELKQENDLTI